ncbi:MAG: nicotinate-nucleotide adenylyltransferase [Verrucomicrobia bacterium]|nr:nicotinate-nucleotide adenylyltransferase [Verrucomicrobiota bacterium]MBU4366220.1 nicotinate-nucleotide adenylyltransferase [Verrucomicrobiota bacterium]
MKTRIGILGGSFNPVHLGHLILAQDALETFDLAAVLFVPCDHPPHKPAASLVSVEHRMAMLEAALTGSLPFEVCDLEIRRGGTYSIDTVRALAKHYPKDDLVFIIGSDTLPELHLWKDMRELLRLCRFVTLARPGFDLKAMTEKSLNLEPDLAQALLANVAIGHQVDISASDIRHRVAEGMSIRYLVPDAVDMYIAEHRLYSLG